MGPLAPNFAQRKRRAFALGLLLFRRRRQLDLFFGRGGGLGGGFAVFLLGQARETLVELRQLAAAIDKAMLAGPCRMRLGIDVELQPFARAAIGAAGLELGAVGHDDGDLVIVGVGVFLHRGRFFLVTCFKRVFPVAGPAGKEQGAF